MTRYVKTTTLATWLGFTSETVRIWSLQGKLDRHFIGDALHHSEASVNALIVSANKGMTLPPTFEGFSRKGVRLLRTSVAAEVLGISPLSLHSKLKRGRIGALRFEAEWRFSNQAIATYLAARKGYYTSQMVMDALGCSTRVLYQLVKNGILTPLHIEGSGKWQYFFAPQQVHAFVWHSMPEWCRHQAGAWLQSSNPKPALTSSEVMVALGLGRNEFKALVANRGLVYLTLPSKQKGDRRFLSTSVHQAFLRQEPITPEEIGRIIDADVQEVGGWLEGALKCHLHDHTNLEYRRACLTIILSSRLSPGLTVRNWLMGRRKAGNRPLVTEEAVAEKYGVRPEDVVFAAQRGFLGGLLRPDGIWVFTDVRLRISRAAFHAWLAQQQR